MLRLSPETHSWLRGYVLRHGTTVQRLLTEHLHDLRDMDAAKARALVDNF